MESELEKMKRKLDKLKFDRRTCEIKIEVSKFLHRVSYEVMFVFLKIETGKTNYWRR